MYSCMTRAMGTNVILVLGVILSVSSYRPSQRFSKRMKNADRTLRVNEEPFSQFNSTTLRGGGRIINGAEVPHSQFPFMVSIEYPTGFLNEWATTCGGSIVNTITILTACHCATRDEKIHGNIKYIADPATRRVVAGTAYWDRSTSTKQIRSVQNIVTHPKCRNFPSMDKSFVNDVALYFLKDDLVYNYEVQPMVLPSMDITTAVAYLQDLINTGTRCTTVGWGRTILHNQEQSSSLIGADVELLDESECRDRFCKMNQDHCETDFETNGQFCVASPVASDCFGDSGGPLVCKGYVVGTVSYGDTCLPNLPTVYQGLRPIMEVLAVYDVRIDEPTQGIGERVSSPWTPLSSPLGQLPVDRAIMTELHGIRLLLEELFRKELSKRRIRKLQTII